MIIKRKIEGKRAGVWMANKPKEWQICGFKIFGSGQEAVLKKAEGWIGTNKAKARWIATVNPEFIMKAIDEVEFKDILINRTDINVPDGVGLIWAKAVGKEKGFRRWWIGLKVGIDILRGKRRQALVTGVDLIEGLMARGEKLGWRVFFLGGWSDRAKRTAYYFKQQYPRLKVEGYYGGEAEKDVEDNKELMEKLAKRVDVLLVAYGMGRQEYWLKRNLSKLNVGVAIGVGRSFDYYSGDLKRAPGWMRKMGLEWLYSLIREPKRWKRQLQLPRFIIRVLAESQVKN